MRALYLFLLALPLVFIACGHENPPGSSLGSTTQADTMLPSPAEQLADYQRALDNPPSPVAEHDTAGKPLFYYGRVFIRNSIERKTINALYFTNDVRPFFDEWEWTRHSPIDFAAYTKGMWVYAIASGVQWNILIEAPGIVSAVELNPRFDKFGGPPVPHPALESFLEPGGNLNTQMLGTSGFKLLGPRFPKACQESSLTKTQQFGGVVDFFDGVVNGAGDAFDGVSDWLKDKLKAVGKDIGEVLEKAAQGAKDAIEVLEQLANAGVCALTGSRSHQRIIRRCD
jgi:hypothetical protein